MARRLKTYQTSIGFFDLAVAAPSMKAAAEAWGSKVDVFHKGFGKETDDPEIVAAAMAKPGVVLKRPVGSNAPFSEDAELPHLLADEVKERRAKRSAKSKEPPAPKLDDKANGDAALAFEREQKRRETARLREEAARERRRKRQEEAIARAERSLEKARRVHEAKVKKIENDLAALERQSKAEDARWKKQKEKLENALRRARD
jgi:colicin import membrane protein